MSPIPTKRCCRSIGNQANPYHELSLSFRRTERSVSEKDQGVANRRDLFQPPSCGFHLNSPSFEKPKNLSRFFGCFFTTHYTPTFLNKFKTSTKSFKNDLTCSKAKFFFSIHSGPNFRRHLHCWNHMQHKCSPGNKTQQWHSFGDIQLKQPILIRGCLGYQDKFRNILIFENNGSTIHELAFSTPKKNIPYNKVDEAITQKKLRKQTFPQKLSQDPLKPWGVSPELAPFAPPSHDYPHLQQWISTGKSTPRLSDFFLSQRFPKLHNKPKSENTYQVPGGRLFPSQFLSFQVLVAVGLRKG